MGDDRDAERVEAALREAVARAIALRAATAELLDASRALRARAAELRWRRAVADMLRQKAADDEGQ